MDKPILFYAVRQQPNRATGGTLFVPAIVEREEIVPLDEIVRRAIDRGLTAGLKPSAARATHPTIRPDSILNRKRVHNTTFSCRIQLERAILLQRASGDTFHLKGIALGADGVSLSRRCGTPRGGGNGSGGR